MSSIARYRVGRDGDRYGVWDAATSGWARPPDLDEPAAADLADAMNADAAPGRRPDERRVDPLVPVEVLDGGEWSPAGQLDRWQWHRGGWWGRVAGDPPRWYPADLLRRGGNS